MAQRHSAKRGDSGSVASSVGNGQHANEDNPNHLVYKKVSIFYHLLYYWLSDWGSQRVRLNAKGINTGLLFRSDF